MRCVKTVCRVLGFKIRQQIQALSRGGYLFFLKKKKEKIISMLIFILKSVNKSSLGIITSEILVKSLRNITLKRKYRDIICMKSVSIITNIGILLVLKECQSGAAPEDGG